MNTVRMTHPDVGAAEVPASAVPHWRASGWQIAEPGHAEQQLPEEQTPPRRRRKKEDADGGA